MVSKICRSECDSATGDWQCAHNLIWVEGRRGRGCGASGGFVRCGLMVVETEGEEMTFVEDKSRMTHSGPRGLRSGAPWNAGPATATATSLTTSHV
jgi:hypothetical protein